LEERGGFTHQRNPRNRFSESTGDDLRGVGRFRKRFLFVFRTTIILK
jgi:hypothetical protein